MKRIFNSFNVAEVGLLKTLFEEENIECFTRNEQISMATGSIPFLESQPELWILKDEDEAKALHLLNTWKSKPQQEPEPWICPRCGETNEGQFGACWNCDYLIDG